MIMYMVKITEDKLEGLSEHIEQGLRHLGKAMQCVDSWMEEGGFGHRDNYGMRDDEEMKRYDNYGSRYGMRSSMRYRDDEDWDDMGERYMDEMGERRGRRRRDSRGRYM